MDDGYETYDTNNWLRFDDFSHSGATSSVAARRSGSSNIVETALAVAEERPPSLFTFPATLVV